MLVTRGLLLALALCAGPLAAREITPKLYVEGAALVYDTTNTSDGHSEIESQDVEVFRALLQANPNVTLLKLTSSGGSVWASQVISDIVIDFGLDTQVDGDCDSSCVIIFLAGENRTMTRGSRLGFHQIQWSAENISEYYEREAEDFGWGTPWEFAEWMYLDTQQEVYRTLNYMVSRGVDPGFAIQSIRKPDGNMWRPYRAVLSAAGVLTE